MTGEGIDVVEIEIGVQGFEVEAHRILVAHLHVLDEDSTIGVAGFIFQQVIGVFDVLGGHFPAVDRRQVVKFYPLAQAEIPRRTRSIISQLSARVLRIIGVVCAAGKYQVVSHSSRVSATSATSVP